MLAAQSEANVCRQKCNLKKSRLLIEQDTQHKLGVAFSYLECNKRFSTLEEMICYLNSVFVVKILWCHHSNEIFHTVLYY